MVDFARAAATAKRLVEANGRPVTLYKANRDPDDAAKPWRGTSSAPAGSQDGLAIQGVRMAFVQPGGGLGGLFGRLAANADGELRVNFEQVGLLASSSVTAAGFSASDVEKCDAVKDGDTVWQVVARGELRPASGSLLFAVGLVR